MSRAATVWSGRAAALVLLAAGLTLLAAGSAAAQQREVGLKGSMSITGVSGEDAYDTRSRRGLGFGAFLLWALDDYDWFALQPELHVVTRAAEYFEGGFAYGVSIGYVELPILLRMSLDPDGVRADPHLLLGPTFAFRRSCRVDAKTSRLEISAPCESDTEFRIRSFDAGVIVGAGLGVAVRGLQIQADVRYNVGLTAFDGSEAAADLKHRVLSATAGLSVPFSGRRWRR